MKNKLSDIICYFFGHQMSYHGLHSYIKPKCIHLYKCDRCGYEEKRG